MDDLLSKMRYRSEILLLIPAISAIFFITDYNIFFASSAQAQSQSATAVCNGDGSCFTTFCTDDQPCQTFSSNQPSFVQPSQEVATMQPVDEIPTMQSVEEPTAVQPANEATDQYIEVPVEVCDDGRDNDDDGEVDEECGVATFSSASPIQRQSNGGLERLSEEEDEHSDDESNEVSEEEEDEAQE